MDVRQDQPTELSIEQLKGQFKQGDRLIINDTKVLKRRIFTSDQKEILFIESNDGRHWTVLFPAKGMGIGNQFELPGNIIATLVSKGLPQVIKTDHDLNDEYFERVGEMPLPPYIQKARKERHHRIDDQSNYQTAWAERPGSLAAPTASLHFTAQDIQDLKQVGVVVHTITLHVGLGTFLPINVETLSEHKMHAESVSISKSVWNDILESKKKRHKLWSLGTTVARSLESQALEKFNLVNEHFIGQTDLMITPGFNFQIVDHLLTNFHQPKSTLIALVMAFAGHQKVKDSYQWAIQKKFRLFSYGDLTVW